MTLPSGPPFIGNESLVSLDCTNFKSVSTATGQTLPQYFASCNPSLVSFSWPTDSHWNTVGQYMLAGTLITHTTVPANYTKLERSSFGSAYMYNTGNLVYNSLVEITFEGDITDVGASNYAETFVTSAAQPLRRIIFEGNTAVPTLANAMLFSGTGYTHQAGWIPTGFEGIYVPDSLVSDWKAANNWTYYASVIFGLSDLPAS